MRVRRLAMLLSGLEQIQSQSIELEQYATDGDLASRWLTDISTFGDLHEGCSVADLGAGNGVLGLGAMALGAGRAILVESDAEACDIANSRHSRPGNSRYRSSRPHNQQPPMGKTVSQGRPPIP